MWPELPCCWPVPGYGRQIPRERRAFPVRTVDMSVSLLMAPVFWQMAEYGAGQIDALSTFYIKQLSH